MGIIKCDLCKRKITGEPITAGVGLFRIAELCKKCGFPIVKFLKQHKLIKQSDISETDTKKKLK